MMCPRPGIRTHTQAGASCVNIMKLTIETQNSKMAFELRQDEVESLVWTAFQYATGNQQCQEKPGTQPEAENGENAAYEGPASEDAYAEEGAAWPGNGKAEDPGFPDTAEAQGIPEDAGLSGEPGKGDGTPGFDGDPDRGIQQEPQGQPLPDPAQDGPEQMPSDPFTMMRPRPRKYKGFLLIKCQHCGKLRAFCAKTPIDTYICDCGGKTPIQNLVPAGAYCKCGKVWTYRTNADDHLIEVNCIECGNPIDLVWNERRGKYVTLQDRS